MADNEKFSKKLAAITYKKDARKRLVTAALEKLESLPQKELTSSLFEEYAKKLEALILRVENINEEIFDHYTENEVEIPLEENSDLAEYAIGIRVRINKVREKNLQPSEVPSSEKSVRSNPAQMPPPLKIPPFAGNSADCLEFKNFSKQFMGWLNSCGELSGSRKLSYLLSHLTGYAYRKVSELAIEDENFEVALELLEKEFLDTPFIVNEAIRKLIHSSPKLDSQFEGLRLYLADCWALVHDLKLYERDVSTCPILGFVLTSKLPEEFRRELYSLTKNHYPTVTEILSNAPEILKGLRISNASRSTPKYEKKEFNFQKKQSAQNFKPSGSQKSTERPPATLESFNASAQPTQSPNANETSAAGASAPEQTVQKICKLCTSAGHRMSACTVYRTLAERQRRAVTLELCTLCASPTHKADDCWGKVNKLLKACVVCRKRSHSSVMCPKAKPPSSASYLCIYVQHLAQAFQPYLLPVLSLMFHGSSGSRVVRCLLDTGSQRSYLSWEIATCIRGGKEPPGVEYDLTTFLGSDNRCLGECAFYISIPGRKKQMFAVLSHPEFKVKMRVSQLDLAFRNMLAEGYHLAEPSLSSAGEVVSLDGLLGVDVLQFFPQFRLVQCMLGAAWETPCGLVPFGSVVHFLRPDQVVPISEQEVSYQQPISLRQDSPLCEEDRTSTFVNMILSPEKSYAAPLDALLPDNNVEQGLERMFDLDSFGCTDLSEDVSDYDRVKISQFKDGISFQDGKYHVCIPWKEEIIDKVPSNHRVALAVLKRVVKKLQDNGLFSAYQEVFYQQLQEGIIERIQVSYRDLDNFVWIPHRPVIKADTQVTTKIRPVFNCSLKVDGAPSLNEAAYAGINLMGDIVKLSLYFRSNKKVLISDIKQAFLQIRLSREEDKNKFCFFMQEGEQIVAYRYCSILFGFNASPFILNFVLKHHAELFPEDEAAFFLKSNFYVDNLIVTGNSSDELKPIYQQSVDRMKEGGFCLRSWNSNCEELQRMMRDDNNFVSHEEEFEKVLGFRYFIGSDSIRLSELSLDASANTKRSILSQVSKVFDPLGLMSPVSVGGKTLIRDLWIAQLDWDQVVPEEFVKAWSLLCIDLSALSSIDIPRACLYQEAENHIFVFSDASKSCYGFAVYCVTNGRASLLFAKARVAPIKKRTLPMLELMGAHLALKSLPMILEAFPAIKFLSLTLAVDSQIVLQWILADTVNTKNLFTRNRIMDIKGFLKALFEQFGLSTSLRYVPTDQNPSDMLTRGLTLAEFSGKLSFWLSGPEWLPEFEHSWPESDLGCLSASSKKLTQPVKQSTSLNILVELVTSEGLIDINRFPSLKKLLRVTRTIYHGVNCFRRLRKMETRNPDEAAMRFWIGDMQKSCFAKELTYLRNPQGKKENEIPILVNSLNLFLDNEGLIRSKGRIGKSLNVEFEVANPILLARNHRFTTLVVEFYHEKGEHLGLSTSLHQVRAGGFWIPRMRQEVKKILGRCMICKKINGMAFTYPKMTNLPKDRVNLVSPYRHTGVDFSGHLWIKQGNNDATKVYLLIFTCLNIRAVHIEIVPDMSTRSFVLAFIRFTNTHGVPSHIYSDNAKAFIAGCKAIQDALICDEFKEQFQIYGVQHVRIPLYSAWVGATWERMIRTIKSCLMKAVGRARLDYFELLTVVGDIQSAVNSRPLTYRSSENDLEPITPNCFLKGTNSSQSLLRPQEDTPLWEHEAPTRESLLSTLDNRDNSLMHFKQLWYDDYLLSLREHCRNLHLQHWENKVRVGDVVLIKVPNKPRPLWSLGIVDELVEGDDSKVRSVRLRKGDGSICLHSIKHLYPMELSLTHNVRVNPDSVPGESPADLRDIPEEDPSEHELGGDDSPNLNTSNQNSAPETSEQAAAVSNASARPKRAAASACRSKMHEWCAELV